MRALEVYCADRLTGRLEDDGDGLAFRYDDAWVAAAAPPLSQSLPLGRDLPRETVRAFFAGLLPEGRPLRQLARRLGTDEGNVFRLLEEIGGDCPGALSLYRPGAHVARDAAPADVRWLEEHAVAELIATLPARPMLAGEDGEIRLSLAGAQDKLPVIVDEGRIGITSGRTPSTDILKTPIPGYDGTVVNEAFCLMLGRELGLPAAPARPHEADGARCLLVARYDRERGPDGVARLHQEDFCQAMGVAPERKYQADGGPSLADCFALVRTATSVPARHLATLLGAVGLNYVVGNHDAHAKNFSLLYRADGVELAPLYDILSTAAYRDLSRKMAMKIGGESRPDYVAARHVDRMIEAAGLAPAAARKQLGELAAAAPSAARRVQGQLADEGWDDPILETLVGIVDRRAAHLERIALASRT